MRSHLARFLLGTGVLFWLWVSVCELRAEPSPKREPTEQPATRGLARESNPPRVKHKPSSKRGPRRNPDEPPACPGHRRRQAAAPPARSMPEMFQRIGERFAQNPAGGFHSALEELALLEEPALQGVSVSEAEERRAGRRAREEYLTKARGLGYKVVEDPTRLTYLQSLVDRLAARMKHRDRYPKIDVGLIQAPMADGQSFPGGSLIFTTALLDEPDEATVAGVVAHELAHLDLGHLYGYVRRSKLAEATYSPTPGTVVTFDRFFTQQAALFGLLLNPFRPEHETEADCLAATWLYQEGYDPRALVGFFERMHDRKKDRPGDTNPFLNFGRTHPYSLDRRDHVRARLAQLQRWRRRDDLQRFAEELRHFRVRQEQKEPAPK